MASNVAKQRLPDSLFRLLDKFPAVGVETLVDRDMMEQAAGGAEVIAKLVGRDLGSTLARFIADNILLDKPGVLAMEDDYARDCTRFRAQIHVLSKGEMMQLLREAFALGREYWRL